MVRISLGLALVLAIPRRAAARIFQMNQRLDHALWPAHDPKLVVAGEVEPGEEPGTIRFCVRGVILGSPSYQRKTLKIPVDSFLWPTSLVSSRKGTSCILVLQPSREKQEEKYRLCTVVPARKKDYPRAGDAKRARAILADELLAQLETEKSRARQREMLLQLTPILAREKAGAVETFLKSKDPWVRRAALSALVYATEDPKHVAAAARDVQNFLTRTKGVELIGGLEPGVRMRPKTLLLEHYFFLEKTTWTWGTRWCEEEANKHLRILKRMENNKGVEEWVKKQLRED